MQLSQIFYTKPSITAKEIDYATDAATTGWGAKCYDGCAPYWNERSWNWFWVSYSLYNRGVNLPCYHDITEEDVDRVVGCLRFN